MLSPRTKRVVGEVAVWAAVTSPLTGGAAAIAGLEALGHQQQTRSIERSADSGFARYTGVEVVDGVYLGLERRGTDGYWVRVSPVVISRSDVRVTAFAARAWDGTEARSSAGGGAYQATDRSLTSMDVDFGWMTGTRFDSVKVYEADASVLAVDQPGEDVTIAVTATIDGMIYQRDVRVPYDAFAVQQAQESGLDATPTNLGPVLG